MILIPERNIHYVESGSIAGHIQLGYRGVADHRCLNKSNSTLGPKTPANLINVLWTIETD